MILTTYALLITEIPTQNTLRVKTRFFASYHYHKMGDRHIKSKRINAAIAAIRRGDFIHYGPATKHFKYDRGTLSRRIRGLTKSKKEADSFWR